MKYIKKLLKKILKFIGIYICNINTHLQLIYQRDSAIKQLATQIELDSNDGNVGIIFSRDRALQLYTLLSSYQKKVKNPIPLIVFYSTSTHRHSKSYLEIEKYFQDKLRIDFVDHGGNFYDSLVDLLEKINCKKVFFLCDDNIFIKDVDLSIMDKINTQDYILSMRCSPYLKYSYTLNTKLHNPKLTKSEISDDLLKFSWFEAPGEWSYPWSIDGHIFSLPLVRSIILSSKFQAPNSFESVLTTFNSIYENKYGLCFKFSTILNLPINQVQVEYKIKHGDITTDFLLEKWVAGYAFETSIFDEYIPISVHEEFIPTFVKRNTTKI